MREIKFRAWQDNKIVHLDGLVLNPPSKSILMQYTGLKDKYDTEIYEGDILLCECRKKRFWDFENPNPPEESFVYKKSVIEWWQSHCSLGYRLRDVKGKTLMVKPSSLRTMNVEVIGNIYENPELLEATT